ncbi:MAG TPA: ribonuclease III [Bacteroidales bacterium]|jgi:ribonuclease-3|nr:ribonuclease III [Bacteroidales bacterium]MDI9574608.1 ribonuclease III [Bacteroidota bacterium]OQC59523.1 MAG: Ribonuclease 3 [Bacteroidetes bacterium ADurb.Bin012]MBP9512116.1 ribonuclease III [Bacteroidales bacterium]MBP9588645.1 ribonuclease III [Bacteroidales bacterium]
MRKIWFRIRIHFSNDKKFYIALKNIFGFWPENIFLYKLALRHKSAALEFVNGERLSNERLEFLGDAILDAVVAHYLFQLFPLRDEGFLTQMRSKIVNRQQLNALSHHLGLDNYIVASREINHVRSINGNALEALIGALFLDKGFKFAEKVIINRILKIHFDLDELQNKDFNFKSKLIEWGQKEKHQVNFLLRGETGKGMNKQYLVEVLIDQKKISEGRDFSIKGAEQIAAEKAILRMKEIFSTSSFN